MGISNQTLPYLFQRYLDRTATPSELKELTEWVSNSDEEELQKVLEPLISGKVTGTGDVFFHKEHIRKQVFQQISAQLDVAAAASTTQHSATPHKLHFLKTGWFRYAAALILLAGTAAYLYTTSRQSRSGISVADTGPSVPQMQDIPSGSSKALLTLSDGRTITLDSTAIGTIAEEGSTRIIKPAAGSLAYTAGEASGKGGMNTISTPNGGQYQITLPDGTKVWLNAASSIQFPTAFTARNREVSITGEAYLEIAPDPRKPFYVSTGGIGIQVLGTAFNTNAYDNEDNIKTTLVQGSIKIAASILKPGQQAIIPRANAYGMEKIKTVEIDTEEVTAWKNGLFQFKNADITAIMKQLARWYDVDISYDGDMTSQIYVGTISRDVSLRRVLKMLEYTGTIGFELQGRKLIVHRIKI